MPGTLKFAVSFSSICLFHKPNRINARKLTTITAATGRVNCSIQKPRGWWRNRITSSDLPAQIAIAHHPLFTGQFFSFVSEEKGQGHRSTRSGLSLSTQMGPTYASDDDDRNKVQKYDEDKKPVLPPTSNSDRILTLPTILTLGRVAAVPLLACTFYVDSWWGPAATTGVFLAAAITDWLDGYLARKMNLGTTFGAFLDPVADKLMVAATLILLCSRPFEVGLFGQIPWLFTVPAMAIIGREITMSAVREWASSQNGKLSEAVAVNNLGKWKTATQMTSLTLLLASRDSSLIGAGSSLVTSGVVLLYLSAWLSIWSLFVYMRKICKVLLK